MSKKILMMHSGSDLYGSGRIFLNTVNVLRQEYDVYVLLEREGSLYDQLRLVRVSVELKNLAVLRRGDMKGIGLIRLGIKFFQAFLEIAKYVKQHKIDLIYSNTIALMIGPFVAKLLGLKHVYHIHEIMEEPKIFRRLMFFLMYKMSYCSIAVSEAVKSFWLGGRSNSHKIQRIYNGIELADTINDISETSIANKQRVVVTMIGRINLIKGQDYFLDIIEKYLERYGNSYPPIKALLVGDSFKGYEYLEDALNLRIANIDGPIENLGFQEDIPTILRNTDILIMPSTKPDSLPTVILEAMARSLPVLCTTTGGSVEMIEDEYNGFHLPLNNSNYAAEMLHILVSDAEKRRKMGERSSKIIRSKFSYTAFEKNISVFFNQILH